jgi:hypothetical protein
MTVFVSVNNSKPSGDPDHIKVFANVDAAHIGTKLPNRDVRSSVAIAGVHGLNLAIR